MDQPKTLDIIAMTERVRAVHERRRLARILTGTVVTIAGLRQRSLLGSLLAVAGLALVVRSATGRPLLESATLAGQKLKALAAHSFAVDRDAVDQASWESFPASDPPAHTRIA